MSPENTVSTGKKIFFVHPSVFTQNEFVQELVQQEFEVYIIKDETKLKKVLKKYPDSIVFASIDETLSAAKWEEWIRSVMGDQETLGIKVGILSNTNNEEARKLYVKTLEVPFGFIPLKLDKTKVIKTLIDILNGAEAKGRRKYLRADIFGEPMTTINVPHNNDFITGEIRDISVVGLSCVFNPDPELTKNSLLEDLQVKLQGSLLKAEGIVFGSRPNDMEKIYVIIFTQKVDPSVRSKIRTYIQKNLQTKMEAELK